MRRPPLILSALLMLPSCTTVAPIAPVAQPPAAATAADPRVEELIERYSAWRGGEAFERLQSVYLVADLDYQGMKGTTREWRERSGRARDEYDLGVLHGLSVRTPTAGWSKDEALVSPVGRFELEDTRRLNLVEFGEALRGGPGASVERLPDEDIDGRRLSVLRVTFRDADFYDLLIDPATGALHGRRVRTDGSTQFTRLGDWRVVDGVRMPFLVESYRPNGKLNATV